MPSSACELVPAPLMPDVALVELPPMKGCLSSSKTEAPRSSNWWAAGHRGWDRAGGMRGRCQLPGVRYRHPAPTRESSDAKRTCRETTEAATNDDDYRKKRRESAFDAYRIRGGSELAGIRAHRSPGRCFTCQRGSGTHPCYRSWPIRRQGRRECGYVACVCARGEGCLRREGGGEGVCVRRGQADWAGRPRREPAGRVAGARGSTESIKSHGLPAAGRQARAFKTDSRRKHDHDATTPTAASQDGQESRHRMMFCSSRHH